MYKRIYLLPLLLSLLTISAYAQVDADIIRPSVNAEQFGLSVKAETALNKGQLSLNIPLMTLKGKGYDLPISLTFYNGDVTTCTEASPVGLGWALMAGGVIASTIRGADDIDTYTSGWSIEHQRDSNYIRNEYNDNDLLIDIQCDPMPDDYTYSLPGHSGTIEVSFDNNAINKTLFPDESYKIESTSGGYCITADDGTKYYFEAYECRRSGTWPETTESTSWFLTKIVTNKGGEFTFHYTEEEYIDLSSTRTYNQDYAIYHTQRIDSICSEFGSVTFNAVSRNDRGNIDNRVITSGLESKRINQIVLKDENGNFVKGYELDNSDSFRLHESINESPDDSWYNRRLKLSSITQFDEAGNRLPPYRFTYDYRFSKSKLTYVLSDIDPEGYYVPYDSWTSYIGSQAYVDIYGNPDGSYPYCYIANNQPNSWPIGYTSSSGEGDGTTTDDYFCLDSIYYPTGAIDVFFYEPHRYGKINNTIESLNISTKIQGRRLASKISSGSSLSQRTDYVYKLHDANYSVTNSSSGVLTNPSIHSATYYTPEWTYGMDWIGLGLVLRSSRVSSGKPFNSFMGPPVCYTEVEEIVYDEYTQSRTIHYFEPQIVSPPVNYLFVHPQNAMPKLVKIDNIIFGKKTGYRHGMESCNYNNHTYMAYPVGEFCNIASVVDKPLKEVFLDNDDRVRSIKNYSYDTRESNIDKRYGYKIIQPENSDYALISQSEYITNRVRLLGTDTTVYFYDEEDCDSIQESNQVYYNKGRVFCNYNSRGNVNNNENNTTYYYFPDDIPNIEGNNTSPTLAAINGLIQKNHIADPIKTVVKRNGKVIGGECKDYKMLSGEPLLNSLYKLKDSNNNYNNAPTISGNDIDYHADLFKEGEVMTYDEHLNPAHVRLNNTLDRIYVWGYGGRFPIAVIDNMDYTSFQAATNLKSQILQLAAYKTIETEQECTSLRNLNAAIRSLLPDSAHITTFTYDPYIGMTSEMDDSNLGIIYTYDSFGRMSAKYDAYYRKTEEYNYHLKLQ